MASGLAIRGIPSIVFAGFGRKYSGVDESADHNGKRIIESLRDYGVNILPVFKEEPSCEIYTLLHGWDKNRTFAVELGAAAAVDRDDIPFTYLELASHIFLTQYKLADNPRVTKAIAKKAWQINKVNPDLAKIILDFSSVYHMELGERLLEEFLNKGVYMILANVEESKYLFGVDIYGSEKDRLDVARELLESAELVVLKLNDEGALIANKKGYFHAPAVKPIKKVNENGLGDGLAVGVLEVLIKYGYNHIDYMQKAISLGVERASEVYAVPGPKKKFNAKAYNRITSNNYNQITPW